MFIVILKSKQLFKLYMYTILILFSVISCKAHVCINFELYESTPMISLYGLESAYCPPGNKPVVRLKGNTCLAWIDINCRQKCKKIQR